MEVSINICNGTKSTENSTTWVNICLCLIISKSLKDNCLFKQNNIMKATHINKFMKKASKLGGEMEVHTGKVLNTTQEVV